MKTKQEVEREFLEDLGELLKKYDSGKYQAKIEAADHWIGYPECGEDVRITIKIPSILDGENARERAEIDIERWIDATKALALAKQTMEASQ